MLQKYSKELKLQKSTHCPRRKQSLEKINYFSSCFHRQKADTVLCYFSANVYRTTIAGFKSAPWNRALACENNELLAR